MQSRQVKQGWVLTISCKRRCYSECTCVQEAKTVSETASGCVAGVLGTKLFKFLPSSSKLYGICVCCAFRQTYLQHTLRQVSLQLVH